MKLHFNHFNESQYLKNVETAMNLFTINKTLQHKRANITNIIRQKKKINAKIYCALKENIYIIIIVFTTNREPFKLCLPTLF